MKNFLKVFILAAGLVLCFNANSFANFSLGGWVGYASTEIDVVGHDESFECTGPQFGLKAHYNIAISETFDLGIGAYFRYSKYSGSIDMYDPWMGPMSFDVDFTRQSIGADINLIYQVAEGFYPYARFAYSFSDKFDMGDESESGSGWGIGAGVEYDLNPTIILFGEIMYESSSLDGLDATSIAFNIGAKFNLF